MSTTPMSTQSVDPRVEVPTATPDPVATTELAIADLLDRLDQELAAEGFTEALLATLAALDSLFGQATAPDERRVLAAHKAAVTARLEAFLSRASERTAELQQEQNALLALRSAGTRPSERHRREASVLLEA